MKLTANELLKAAKLHDKIEKLESEYEKLMTGGGLRGGKTASRAKKKRRLSKEARAKTSAAAKKRWKKARA